MKCNGCKFFVLSKMVGNHCVCRGERPCERERIERKRKKLKKDKKNRYNTKR